MTTESESDAPAAPALDPPSMTQVVLIDPPNGMTLRYIDAKAAIPYVGSLTVEVGDGTRVLEMVDAFRAYIVARQEAQARAAKPS